MLAEIVLLKLVEKLFDYALSKGLDQLFKAHQDYKGRLAKIIYDTNDEYEKQHELKAINDNEIAFYDSQILLEQLLTYHFFGENANFTTDSLKNALSENPNILIPTENELKQYLDIFNGKLKNDEKLKSLAIEENYKNEIFIISSLTKEFLIKLNEIESEIKQLKNNNTFESFIKKKSEEIRRKNDAISVLNYQSDQFDYVNRPEENRLKEFCDDERPFCWWTVTGPGGSGKSRMVREFILQNKDNDEWTMKFLSWDDKLLTFDDYEYPTNLFLVIDCAASHAAEIGKWAVMLTNIREKKIRLLLIERTGRIKSENGIIYPHWYQRFLNDYDAPECILLNLFEEEFLEMNGLSNDSLTDIAYNYLSARNKKICKDEISKNITKQIQSIDKNKKTPIYILLLAEAWMLKNNKINNRDVKILQDWINNNELKRLKGIFCVTKSSSNIERIRHNACEAGTYLQAFATSINSLNLQTENRIFEVRNKVKTIKLFEDTINLSNNEILKELCENDQGYILRAIVPDIIGEYFTVSYLQKLYSKMDKSDFLKFTDNAWKYYRNEYSAFLNRLAEDFYNLPFVINTLLCKPSFNDEEVDNSYLTLQKNIVAIVDKNRAANIIDRLNRVVSGNSSTTTQVLYAECLANYSYKLTDEVQLKKVAEKLKKLNYSYPQSTEIKVAYTKGMVNESYRVKDEERINSIAHELKRIETVSDNFFITKEVSKYNVFLNSKKTTNEQSQLNLLANTSVKNTPVPEYITNHSLLNKTSKINAVNEICDSGLKEKKRNYITYKVVGPKKRK